jgi:hypothetical protein
MRSFSGENKTPRRKHAYVDAAVEGNTTEGDDGAHEDDGEGPQLTEGTIGEAARDI